MKSAKSVDSLVKESVAKVKHENVLISPFKDKSCLKTFRQSLYERFLLYFTHFCHWERAYYLPT